MLSIHFKGDRLEHWKLVQFLELAGIFLWLSNLITTNAYFSVYCLCGIAAVYCIASNHRDSAPLPRKVTVSSFILSLLFALAVVLANYPIFQQVRDPATVSADANQMMNVLECIATFLGGIPVCFALLQRLYRYSTEQKNEKAHCADGAHPVRFFLIAFALIVVIDLIYLFLVDYPGNISHDSMRQINQNHSGQFDNRLPYWYTRLIGLVMGIGYGIFGTANAAAAFYSFLQVLAMGAIFAFVLMTLYERRCSWLAIGCGFAFYAFIPYNIAFSTSMWKDVLFTGFMLLLLTCQYRLLKDMGRKPVNLGLMLLAGIGVGIMRTNGWYVMAIAFVILLLCWKNIRRTLALGMGVITLVTFLLNVPMLKLLGAAGIDEIETMSIPMQQVARVVAQGRELSEEDQELLNRIIDLEKIPELYQEWTCDPVKYEISLYHGEDLLENKAEYASLWLRLGRQYPMDYLEAWVEQTKGYWNAGYDYYIYAEYVADNDYGIVMDQSMNPIKSLVKAYFAFSRESIFFEPLLSVGLSVWICLAFFWLAVIRRKREAVLYIPLLVLLAGLWVGTPVFCEFRYAYPVAASLPLLVATALSRDPQ